MAHGDSGYLRFRNDQLAIVIENDDHLTVPALHGGLVEAKEFAMSHIRRAARHNKTMLMKTGSYYLIHICVAALVAYAVTGNLWASLTLSLLEPTVQAVAFFFHEKAWERAARRHAGNAGALQNA
jgi:uncharacterized membrane protein